MMMVTTATTELAVGLTASAAASAQAPGQGAEKASGKGDFAAALAAAGSSAREEQAADTQGMTGEGETDQDSAADDLNKIEKAMALLAAHAGLQAVVALPVTETQSLTVPGIVAASPVSVAAEAPIPGFIIPAAEETAAPAALATVPADAAILMTPEAQETAKEMELTAPTAAPTTAPAASQTEEAAPSLAVSGLSDVGQAMQEISAALVEAATSEAATKEAATSEAATAEAATTEAATTEAATTGKANKDPDKSDAKDDRSSDRSAPPTWAAAWQHAKPAEHSHSVLNTQSAEPPQAASHVQAQSIVSQVIDQADMTWQNGDQIIEIKLNPDNFGDLQIRLVKGEQGLTAQIRTDNAETSRLLTSHVAQLQDSLQSKGLTVSEINIQYSAAGQDQPGRQQQNTTYEKGSLPRRAGLGRSSAANAAIAAADTAAAGNAASRSGKINYLA